MKIKKKISFKLLFFLMLLINIYLISVLAFGKSDKKWLTWIKDENGKTIDVIYQREFVDFYKALVYSNILNSPTIVPDDKLKELLNNEDAQKKAMETMINYSVMTYDAVRNRAVDMSDVKKEARILLNIIEKQIIMRNYLLKVILPDVKVDDKKVQKIFDAQMKKNKVDNPDLLLQQIEARLKFQVATKTFMEKIKQLVDEKIVKKNRKNLKNIRIN